MQPSGLRGAARPDGDVLHGMQDPRLPLRLLSSLLSRCLPAIVRDDMNLDAVRQAVTLMHSQQVFSEPDWMAVGSSTDARKKAMDVWVQRLLMHLSSPLPENRRGAAILSGLSALHSTNQRFVDLYPPLLAKLMAILKSCAATSARERGVGGGSEEAGCEIVRTRSRQARQQQQRAPQGGSGAGGGGVGVGVQGLGLRREESGLSGQMCLLLTATCKALVDVFTRLGTLSQVQGIKKEASTAGGKICLILLDVLPTFMSSQATESALGLLQTLLHTFPSCAKQHMPVLEACLVSLLCSPHSTAAVRQSTTSSLVLLPRSAASSAVWSSFQRRLLLAINSDLDALFAGFEEASSRSAATALLLPPGYSPPPPLTPPASSASFSFHSMSSQPPEAWQAVLPRIHWLMELSQQSLLSPFPVPVPVPISSILALINRILSVDGSRKLPDMDLPMLSLDASFSREHQQALCCALPVLHTAALRLLTGLLQGCRSHLLPHAASISYLFVDAFRTGPSYVAFRTQLYRTATAFINALGAGMMTQVAPAVVGLGVTDLKSCVPSLVTPTNQRTPGGSMAFDAASGPDGSLGSNSCRVGNQCSMRTGGLSSRESMELQLAVLEILEAILVQGGSLLPEHWRMEVDAAVTSAAVIAVNTSSLTAGQPQCTTSASSGSPLSSDAVALATCRTLLASVLSPCPYRPPFLPQALRVFRIGRMQQGSALSSFCSLALLSLDPLLHPRCLPHHPNARSQTRPAPSQNLQDPITTTPGSTPSGSLLVRLTEGQGGMAGNISGAPEGQIQAASAGGYGAGAAGGGGGGGGTSGLPVMAGQEAGGPVGQQGSNKDLWPQMLADLWSDPNVGYSAYGHTLATFEDPAGAVPAAADMAADMAAAQSTQPAPVLIGDGSDQVQQQQQQGVGFSSLSDLSSPKKGSLAARRGGLSHGPLPAGKAVLQGEAGIGSHQNPVPSPSLNPDMLPPRNSERPTQVTAAAGTLLSPPRFTTDTATDSATALQQQQQHTVPAVAPSVEQQRKEAGDEIFRRTLTPALSKFLSSSAASSGDGLSSPSPSSVSVSGAAQPGRQLKRPHRGSKKAAQERAIASGAGGSLSAEGVRVVGMEEGGLRVRVGGGGRSAEEQAAEAAALTTAQRARRNRAKASELAKALLPASTGPQPGGGAQATWLPGTGAHLGMQEQGVQTPVTLEGSLGGSRGGSRRGQSAAMAAGSVSVGVGSDGGPFVAGGIEGTPPVGGGVGGHPEARGAARKGSAGLGESQQQLLQEVGGGGGGVQRGGLGGAASFGGQAPDEDSDGPLPDIVIGPDDFP